MGTFRGWRALVSLAGLWLSAACFSAALAQTPSRTPGPGRSADTASVAELAVPPSAREHLERARKAAQANREDIYQREMQKTLAIAPDFAEAYLVKASQENAAAQCDAALEDALKAQSLAPHAPWTAVVIATAYNGIGRFDAAFLVLSNMQSDDAETWQAKYEMARAELGRRDVESALHWSTLALQSAPERFVDARLLLANALQMAHRWREASTQMEIYLASNSPLVRRAPVTLALTHTRLLARQQELQTQATQ